MSIVNKLRAWWTFKHNSGHRGARLYLLDAGGLFSSRRGGGRASPSDQARLLQRLARFAKKEKIKLTVVLEGKPLREVKGCRFEDLQVRFADQGSRVGDLIVKELKRGLQGANVTVITSDHQTEKKVGELGGDTMRSATLKKALESVSGEAREGGSSPQRRGPRRRRRPARDESAEKNGGESKQETEVSDDAAVRDQLDLVE